MRPCEPWLVDLVGYVLLVWIFCIVEHLYSHYTRAKGPLVSFVNFACMDFRRWHLDSGIAFTRLFYRHVYRTFFKLVFNE